MTRSPFLNKRAIADFEDPFLKMENIDFALVIDRNGYIPIHHAANSRQLTGDLKTDHFRQPHQTHVAKNRGQNPDSGGALPTHITGATPVLSI